MAPYDVLPPKTLNTVSEGKKKCFGYNIVTVSNVLDILTDSDELVLNQQQLHSITFKENTSSYAYVKFPYVHKHFSYV